MDDIGIMYSGISCLNISLRINNGEMSFSCRRFKVDILYLLDFD